MLPHPPVRLGGGGGPARQLHPVRARRCGLDGESFARASRRRADDVGIAWVNSWFLRDLRTAFGGAKQSGIGREGGLHSLEFYTELTNVCVKL